MTRICDYEGSKYRTEFWESQNRVYEDAVERVAMKSLLPPRGKRLLEIGAGFGRLVDLYQEYEQIVLVDYARTQLEEAQKYLGDDERLIYVASNIYDLPFVDNLFDSLTMVRVMHHLTEVPAALSEIHRVVTANGAVVVEHASKFHLKSLVRWLLRRQRWSPFDPNPVEFVELNFNFHPGWMRQQFEIAGLQIKNIRTVSHYRINLLKRLVPTPILVKLDSWTQSTGNWWQLSPSIFLQAQPKKEEQLPVTGFFRCPICKSTQLVQKSISEAVTLLTCQNCQRIWSFKNGIFDFKEPLNSTTS